MNKKYLGLTGILFVTLACGLTTPSTPGQPGVETIVAETLQAFTSVAPATPIPISGTVIALNNISFVIPTGIGNGAQAEAIPASLDPNAPYWDIHPAYTEIPLAGYVLQNTFHQPKIYIYPADEYAKVHEGAADIISRMQELLANQNAPMPQNMPFMPLFNAGQVFHSNEKFLTFQNGTGVRFLTQFAQAPFPVNNHDLFYTFQGLTNDGAYYISAILPINATFLPADGKPETPLPADGVPFDWVNFENLDAHFELVKQKLNATDPNAFSPSLINLDALIQSMLITGTP
jgi:hypothetical protein